MATAVLILTCLTAPPALLAEDIPPTPPPTETTTTPTPPPPPADTIAPDPVPTTGSAEETATLLVAKRGGVTIADFSFSPASITISAGDTVSWTNQGPSEHTVTADDGSFDSGNIADGAGFSRTYSSAGTFAYHCSIHDEMKGTVVVQNNGTGPSSDGGTSGDTTGTDPGATAPTSESAAGTSPSAAGTADSLPSTGQVELPLALAGGLLLLAGDALRRISRRRA